MQLKIKFDDYIINKIFVRGKSKHIVNWLILILYFSLLFVNIFHVHQNDFKIYSQLELSKQENVIDPFKDESGICRAEQFFNYTFNGQLKSASNHTCHNQTIAIIQINFVFNPLLKFFSSTNLRSPPFLF
ncbi:MAG: hypothetical protein WHS65_03825 [Melioribacteraceae bacterium]